MAKLHKLRGSAAKLSLGLLLIISSGCITTPATTPTWKSRHNPKSFAELSSLLLAREPQSSIFTYPGPFPTRLEENTLLNLGPNLSLLGDLLVSQNDSASPLVIIVHGNASQKEAHRYQAQHLASWGMTTLVLQLPNRNNWLQNGHTVEAVVRKLRYHAKLAGTSFDPSNIILMGHSFGGSAITIAASLGAKIKGLVLLDPAVVHEDVKERMNQVALPVMLIGADRNVFRAKHRSVFFQKIAGEFGEISVKGATHDDAQFPSMFSLSTFGIDPFTSPEKQQVFLTALTTAAFALSSHGNLSYAWRAYQNEIERGHLIEPRYHAAK